MKILAIRLSNLASLAGRHEVDFRSEPLADAGLFAITGPTGAGKSTLLDALCLALFGNTPRLRGAPSVGSKIADLDHDPITTSDPRTLLRRGCGEGEAEVDFVGVDGREYRATWHVRRARGKPTGRLQAADQSLRGLPDETILTTQKRAFVQLIEEKLGLNFEQFTRAVLLAQNEFSTFLKADDDQRGALLEKLTSSNLYSRISVAAYQKQKHGKDAVEALERQLEGQIPADETTRQQLEQQAQETEAALKALVKEQEEIQAQRRWLMRDRELGGQSAQASVMQQQAQQAYQALDQQRHELNLLQSLAPVRTLFVQAKNLRGKQERNQGETEQLTKQQAQLQTQLEQAQQQLSLSHNQLEQVNTQQRQSQGAIDAARQLEISGEHLANDCEKLSAEQNRLRQEHQQLDNELDTIGATQQKDEERLKTLHQALGDAADPQAHWELLQHQLDDLRGQTRAWQDSQRDWRLWCEISQKVKQEEKKYLKLQSDTDITQTTLEPAESALGDAMQALEHTRHTMNALRAARSEKVEQLRQQLSADQPCPVCGSTQHPYREHPPASTDRELLAATVAAEQRQIQECEENANACRSQRDELKAQLQQIKIQLEAIAENLPALRQNLSEALQTLKATAQGNELLSKLNDAKAGGQTEYQAAQQLTAWLARQCRDSATARDALEQEIKPFGAAMRQLRPLQEAIHERALKIKEKQTNKRNTSGKLKLIDSDLPPKQNQLKQENKQLQQLLGPHKSAEIWRRAMDSKAEQARETHQQQQQQVNKLGEQLKASGQNIRHCEKLAREQQQELAAIEEKIIVWRREQSEIDEPLLRQLLQRDDQYQQELSRRIRGHEEQLREANTLLTERRRQWLAHRRQYFEAASADELTDETQQEAISRLDARISATETAHQSRHELAQEARDQAREQLAADDRKREQNQQLQQALEQARAEYRRWGRIADLIGSSDGKKFRLIAQAYNLDLLLAHANQHLHRIARRYRLIKGGSMLGLLVIDTAMGDEQRSVHSLSGGESFLVSLALALGLASMAAGRMNIESLFIDEGFGSLDPQSLAIVMDALDSLQAQGRRVGVISHVPEMHERIPVRIVIEPSGQGHSRLRVVS